MIIASMFYVKLVQSNCNILVRHFVFDLNKIGRLDNNDIACDLSKFCALHL